MILTSLKIDSLPGIAQGFEIDAAPDRINIVEGPNGSGKTTLCRALQAIFWPGTPKVEDRVTASFQDDADILIATLAEGRVRWRRNGDICDPPAKLDDHLKHCVLLRIDELLQGGDIGDSEMAARIAREMSGGYDLDALKSSDLFRVAKHPGLNRPLEEAQREYDALRLNLAALADREKTLPDLAVKQDAALAARSEIATLNVAAELAAARDEAAVIAAEAVAFPDGIDQLESSDGKHVEEYAQRIESLAAEIEKAHRDIEDAERRIEAYRFSSGVAVKSGDVEAWEQMALEWRNAEQALLRDAKDLAAAIEAHDAVKQRVASADATFEPQLTPDAVKAAAACVRARAAFEHARAPLELQLVRLGDRGDAVSSDTVKAGVRELLEWLALPDAAARRRQFPTLLTFVGVIAAVCVIAAGVKPPVALAAVLVWVIADAIVALARKPAADPGEQRRDACRERYRRTGLPDPASWQREHVQARVDELGAQVAEALASEERVRRRSEIAREIEALDETEAGLAANEADVARQYGIDLTGAGQEFIWFLDDLVAYRNAVAAMTAAQCANTHSRTESARLADTVNGFLAAVDEPPCENATLAQAALLRVKSRCANLADAHRDLSNCQSDADRVRAAIARETDGFAAFLADRGCASVPEFERVFRMHASWKQHCESKRDADVRIAQLTARLSLRPELLDAPSGEIAALLSRAEHDAAEYSSLTHDIERIKAEVDAARNANRVAAARSAVDTAREEIVGKRETALLAVAAQALLDQVEMEHEKSQSGVLQQASTLFARFTNNKYSLHVKRAQAQAKAAGGADLPSRYSAFDVEAHMTKSLAELSAGTRVQLLIAARVAFAVSAQGSVRLPLFFDEVLKHCDPMRTNAIVKAMGDLLLEQRQIFYLTNDPNDVARLSSVLEGAGHEPPHVVDLALVRKLATGWRGGAMPVVAAARDIAAPNGATPTSYAAAIGVPRFMPMLPADAAHLFYVLDDDLPTLHDLVVRGIETVGSWRNRDGRVHLRRSGVTLETEAMVDRRCDVLGAFVAAYRRGRPRLLSYAPLIESGVSKSFIERFWNAAQGEGLDGARLLAAIDAKHYGISGVRGSFREAFEEWLRDNDYVTSLAPVTAVEITTVACGAASQLDPQVVRKMVHRLYEYANLSETSVNAEQDR